MSIEDYGLMHRLIDEERSRQQMNEQFSILIDSRARFETGEQGGVWLSMPTTTEQLHEAMRSVGITADNPQDFSSMDLQTPNSSPLTCRFPLSRARGLTS